MTSIINPYKFAAPLLIDQYAGARAAYSVRKLKHGYTGAALRVRRSNDNAEQDIGFDSSGNLDESALTTFTGANSGFVTKWYDQSGNGYDAPQTTNANQPRIVNAGTIDKLNGQPAFGYVSTGHLVIVSSNMLRNVDHAELYLVGSSSSTGTRILWYAMNNASAARFFLSKNFVTAARFGISARRLDGDTVGTMSSNTADNANQALVCAVAEYSTRNGILRQNGAQVGSNATLTTQGFTSDTNSSNIWFGGRASTNDTVLQEVIVYTQNQSSNRAAIEDNINGYFDIY